MWHLPSAGCLSLYARCGADLNSWGTGGDALVRGLVCWFGEIPFDHANGIHGGSEW